MAAGEGKGEAGLDGGVLAAVGGAEVAGAVRCSDLIPRGVFEEAYLERTDMEVGRER